MSDYRQISDFAFFKLSFIEPMNALDICEVPVPSKLCTQTVFWISQLSILECAKSRADPIIGSRRQMFVGIGLDPEKRHWILVLFLLLLGNVVFVVPVGVIIFDGVNWTSLCFDVQSIADYQECCVCSLHHPRKSFVRRVR